MLRIFKIKSDEELRAEQSKRVATKKATPKKKRAIKTKKVSSDSVECYGDLCIKIKELDKAMQEYEKSLSSSKRDLKLLDNLRSKILKII